MQSTKAYGSWKMRVKIFLSVHSSATTFIVALSNVMGRSIYSNEPQRHDSRNDLCFYRRSGRVVGDINHRTSYWHNSMYKTGKSSQSQVCVSINSQGNGAAVLPMGELSLVATSFSSGLVCRWGMQDGIPRLASFSYPGRFKKPQNDECLVFVDKPYLWTVGAAVISIRGLGEEYLDSSSHARRPYLEIAVYILSQKQ